MKMNKYFVVYQFPDGTILNKVITADKITEELITSFETKVSCDSFVTILNIIKLDE